MATADTNSAAEGEIDNERRDDERSVDKDKLVQELTDMGFSAAAVLKVVNVAGDLPPVDLIVEQLLTTTSDSPEPVDEPVPVVDDDGDQMWEDENVCYKMVIVVNMGLKMGRGKIASQVAHAVLGLYEVIKERRDLDSDLYLWNEQGSRKIIVEAKNTTELIKLCSAGRLRHIPLFSVHDAGLTEVAFNSFTALAFFGSDDQLKPVTGKLKLLK